MNKPYNPKDIEKKWQKYWEKNKTFEVTEDEGKKKFYGLVEFPYPSGVGLHVGHPRPFTAMDVICRKKRMEGYNVLYPMGFDAFGLPTENFAIKTGRPPAEVTAENIANFTRQLKMLGYSFDWSRVVDTTDPKYYKWTQWIFLQLFKHGLAYKKAMPINWCLSCKIGLANEEVVTRSTSSGQVATCERCGGEVEKRNKEQWMLAITKYADKLLQGLETVDYIPQARTQQENWIGRSEGVIVKFRVMLSEVASDATKSKHPVEERDSSTPPPVGGSAQNDEVYLEVFTTRPDTLFGATYMVVAPEHELIKNQKSKIKNYEEVNEYIAKAKNKSDLERTENKDKTGVRLEGLTAVNPVNNEEIPIFVADYVLTSYGTGAIMAVPAHDERDFEFAKKYNLPIKQVVAEYFGNSGLPTKWKKGCYAIIKKDDKFLILFDNKAKLFRLPGGTQEEGETDEITLFREVEEEIGCKVKIHSLLGVICSQTDPRKITGHLRKAYIVDFEKNKQIGAGLDQDNFEQQWLTYNEAISAFNKNYFNTGEQKFIEFANSLNYFCFSDEGININSDFINDLPTVEAKEKMIQYLEEKNIGQRKVQYKLRDWVFSRQRYWGEPIPLVHCEKCENKKYNYVIIHGFTANSQNNWRPWFKSKLEKLGHTVYCPDLPNTNEPNIDEQVDYILKNTKIDDNTILVGHSLGGVVIYKLLEKLNKKVAKVLLVDPVVSPKFPDKERPLVEKSCDWKFNWNKIKKLSNEFVVLGDKNFTVIKKEYLEELAKNLNAKLILEHPEERHFTASEESAVYKQLEQTGWIPLPESELPLELPKVKKYEPTDTGESPLAVIDKWVKTKCPICGGPARRETDTMPNWAGSSWYFLRYCDPDNTKEFASPEKLKYWMNIDWYNGGMEHTVLHLLYSRFWNEFLYDIGVVPTSEPYQKRTSHGMILAPDGEKMSKSRGNVINPDEMVEKFGTDAFRVYIMFMGPFDQAVSWDTNGLVGVRRFLEKVWALREKVGRGTRDEGRGLTTLLHQTIKKVSEDIEAMRFNTAISQMMILVNEMSKDTNHITHNTYQIFLQLLASFAPHICEELWSELGNKESISKSEWPKYDENKLLEDFMPLAVQVNGKIRVVMTVPTDISEEDAKTQALKHPHVQKWLDGKEPKKVIYVKGRLVSVVV